LSSLVFSAAYFFAFSIAANLCFYSFLTFSSASFLT
jgi:hypothetical protein